MKKVIYAAVIAAFIGLSAFVIAGNWKVKSDEAKVEFRGGRISGEFTGLQADINFDKDHPEQAKISATIQVDNIATGFFLKNSHAKDALGADENPTIKYVSTSVSKTGNGYSAPGKLTMKGVTKPVTIHFTFDEQGGKGTFKGDFKVTPKEFNITRNGTPDEVTITLMVPVTKA